MFTLSAVRICCGKLVTRIIILISNFALVWKLSYMHAGKSWSLQFSLFTYFFYYHNDNKIKSSVSVGVKVAVRISESAFCTWWTNVWYTWLKETSRQLLHYFEWKYINYTGQGRRKGVCLGRAKFPQPTTELTSKKKKKKKKIIGGQLPPPPPPPPMGLLLTLGRLYMYMSCIFQIFLNSDQKGESHIFVTPTPLSMACNSKQIGWWHVTFASKFLLFCMCCKQFKLISELSITNLNIW